MLEQQGHPTGERIQRETNTAVMLICVFHSFGFHLCDVVKWDDLQYTVKNICAIATDKQHFMNQAVLTSIVSFRPDMMKEENGISNPLPLPA